MGYFRCKKCGDIYEIQKGKSLNDFNNCKCGGQLDYCPDYEKIGIDKPSGIMPYLHCKECRGIYELQKGESPKDFDVCQCGGKLEYHPHFENIEKVYLKSEKQKQGPENFSSNTTYQYNNSYPTKYFPKSNVKKNNMNPNSGKALEKVLILGFCLFIGTWLNESWFFLIAPLITGITFKKNGYAIGSFLGALILGFSSLIAGFLVITYTLPAMGLPLPSELVLPALVTRFLKGAIFGAIGGAVGVFIGRSIQ